MAVKLVSPTEVMDVSQICVVLYGQPGSRKSSAAQTADNPGTMAFDKGIYRAFGRKWAALFESWADVLAFDPKPYATICADTLGVLLDMLSAALVAENPKNGNRTGGLTLQGYGVLKAQFSVWCASMKLLGKDLVFICHEKEGKNGEDVYYHPDILGGSYNVVMNIADAVGYVHFDGGKRVIDWSPSDKWMAKTPPCGWGRMQLPDFEQEPKFLAKLIAEAKASMGRVSAESAKVASNVDTWRQKFHPHADPYLKDFNGPYLEAFKKLTNAEKQQIWPMFLAHAVLLKWTFDGRAKQFVETKEPAMAGAANGPASA